MDTAMTIAKPYADPFWRPPLIVFCSNVCIMLIQMVASRLIAPVIGVSLYSWTTIIGVMLAGLSVGNFLGGVVADKWASRRLLGVIFILAGLGALSILALFEHYGALGLPTFRIPLILRITLYVAMIFLLPCILLGLISPMVIKLTLRDLKTTGNTMGNIYAASTIGAIIGTFATGFYLISWFGTRYTTLGAGVGLIVLGILLGKWVKHWQGAVLASLVLVAAVAYVPKNRYLTSWCLFESNYFCIRVREEVNNNETFKVLTLDHLVHSYSNANKTDDLKYPYEQIDAEVAEFIVKRDGQVRYLLMGGGGYTMPRYLINKYPADKAMVDVVEIDPMVTYAAENLMGLGTNTLVRSYNYDARQFLTERSINEQKYNIIQADAFNDFSVPYHLTTKEFGALVKRHLTDDGVYLVNMIDGGQAEFARTLIRTVGANFPYLYFCPTNKAYDGITLNTMLLIASPKPLDETALRAARGHDTVSQIDAWLVARPDLDKWLAKGDQLVLSDEYVPTDNLLIPAFENKLAIR
jgi:spermidine synthase